jgi:osmotically-inducible protein OsmY
VAWLALTPRSQGKVQQAADDARQKIEEATPQIKDSLKKTGEALAEATSDGSITAAIKLKFAADPDLSALRISVDTTDGVVTLAGKVASPELVGKAIQVAQSVKGVREVKTTLQVDSGRP